MGRYQIPQHPTPKKKQNKTPPPAQPAPTQRRWIVMHDHPRLHHYHRRALAYFITFRTYGTWLPGDPRGTVSRALTPNGTRHRGPCPALEQRSRDLMRAPPVVLEPAERIVVLATIQEVCRYREWLLRAAHVRTNHVHVVVTAEAEPERIMGDLKAWSTRRVIEAGHRPAGTHLWVRHGSTRYLLEPSAIAATCYYVLHKQGIIRRGTVFPAV